jgi:formylglycine-generating enzyme required for sulfatase activity
MLDFACHAAFPQMLTTDLVYLLRQLLHEQYGLDLPWSAAPELLLSNLCDTAGHDLYGMSVGIRGVLLKQLVAKFKPKRLDELVQWMGEYIKYRLEIDSPGRAKVLGDPSEWTVLACLRNDDEIAEVIKEQLRQLLAETDDPTDRFRLSSLVEDHADLLAQRGLQPFKLQDLARKIEQNNWDAADPADPIEQIRSIMGFNNFPLLQSKEISYATISFEQTEIDSGNALYPFEFETVQVDERGEIVHREQGRAFAFREPLAADIGLEMVAIPSGEFMMGSVETEEGHQDYESPQHLVKIPSFFIGKFAVTQAQWRSVAGLKKAYYDMDIDRSRFKGDNRPVECVSSRDAHEFCARLSIYTGRTYRLPTEAEWEYACRAGTTTPFYFGTKITMDLANYNASDPYSKLSKGISRGETTVVGSFPPNNFGLYDMHGNVWEWCRDIWHDSYYGAPIDGSDWSENFGSSYVLRGGSWYFPPENCRSAARDISCNSGLTTIYMGFRVVCDIFKHWRYYYSDSP